MAKIIGLLVVPYAISHNQLTAIAKVICPVPSRIFIEEVGINEEELSYSFTVLDAEDEFVGRQ